VTYDREQEFVPTLEDPGPVTFLEDGSWVVTRDRFFFSDEGMIQAWMTTTGRAGDVLEPATVVVEGKHLN
jgi:hypothetical protein